MRKGKIEVSVTVGEKQRISPEEMKKSIELLSDDDLDKECISAKKHLAKIDSMITKMDQNVPDAVINLKKEMCGLQDLLQEEKAKRSLMPKEDVISQVFQIIPSTAVSDMNYESEFRDVLIALAKVQGAARVLRSPRAHISEEKIPGIMGILSDCQHKLENLYESLNSEIVRLQEDISTYKTI